jgi:maltose O-acetyltransferase
MRHHARRILREYNATTEVCFPPFLHPFLVFAHVYRGLCQEESEKRSSLLMELLGEAGEGAYIEPPFYCDYGTQIKAGKKFYLNFDCIILDCALVEIGDNVFCAPKVQIYTATHPLDAAERAKVWPIV